MDEKSDEELLFVQQKKHAEKTMKIVVALFIAIMLYTLYVLVFDD